MPPEKRGSLTSTGSALNYVYMNVMPMKTNGKPTHKEVRARVKRDSKKFGGFKATHRDDGFYYLTSIPRHCDEVQVGDRILEINSTRWSQFQNEKHANAMFDNMAVVFTPEHHDDEDTADMTSLEEENWSDENDVAVEFETASLEEGFYGRSEDHSENYDHEEYYDPDEGDSYYVDEDDLADARKLSALDTVAEEESDDLLSDDDVLKARGFEGNKSEYLKQEAERLVAEKREQRRAARLQQAEEEERAQKEAKQKTRKEKARQKKKEASKLKKKSGKEKASTQEGAKKKRTQQNHKDQSKTEEPKTPSRGRGSRIKVVPHLGMYSPTPGGGGGGWNKVVSP